MTIRVNPLVVNENINKINEVLSALPKSSRRDHILNPMPKDKPGKEWLVWDATRAILRRDLD